MNAPNQPTQLIWPAEGATRAPYSIELDPEIYALEQERIFRGATWNYIGLEAEVPQPGDFNATFVGDTPVVLTRSADGSLHAWVNRCAHRGALVCRENRGSVGATGTFTCVYHQWAYDAVGELVGVPFRKGLAGKGGYPADFDMTAHSLRRLRVESYHGMVFATFAADAPPLEDYLGPEMCAGIARIFARPIEVIGYARQYFNGNWKLYAENTRDSYHGALLHLFYPTFNIYRPAQEAAVILDEGGIHNQFRIKAPKVDEGMGDYTANANRTLEEGTSLADPRVLGFVDDVGDGIALVIQSLFPNVVLQQIQNTLATRQILPKAHDRTELLWTYFGYVGESDEMRRHRVRNINLVGPAGFISMEDGEAVEIVQKGIVRDGDESAFIEMGGSATGNLDYVGLDENSIRGFWGGYRRFMGW